MKPVFHHDFMSSFTLWVDHYLLSEGEAFSNKAGTLYPYADPRVPDDYEVFASPYKQWVTDESIAGLTVPTGIFADGVEKFRGDGVVFDYDNGRVLLSGISPSAVTGAFPVKDFNIYYTNEGEEDLIIENKYKPNHRIFEGTETGIDPYDQVVPAVFLNVPIGQNEPFCFGGMDKTTMRAKAVILAENSYQLDGALSLFQDANERIFKQVPFEDYPYTVYGDLKDGSYNYTGLAAQSSVTFYVDDVVVSKLSDRIKRSIINDLYVGFADFEISTHRYPRQ